MANLTVNLDRRLSHINPEVYGNFSEHLGHCIYDGIYVGESSAIPNVNGMRSDIVAALKAIHLPVLRWPGGCFADTYHWEDGIGPRQTRKRMVNTHWGGVVEDNAFGTHEFFEFCRQVGCEPYINGNLGSGTVREMSEWVEYMTFDGLSPMSQRRQANGQSEPWHLKYFGIGNENWGCGGNMRPTYYADVYRRYQTYVRNYGKNQIFKIACGPNSDDYAWTEELMKQAGHYMDGLSLHYYTVNGDWEHKGAATGFSKADWYQTLKKTLYMEDLIRGHLAVMDRYDPEHKVGLIIDEWGTWFDVEPGTNPGFLYQQNTTRDALVAAVNYNIFNKHSDRIPMTNLAQLVNVLQALILTDGEQMLLTPTYFVADLYQHHQGADLLESMVDTQLVGQDESALVPNLSESASVSADGTVNVTLANLAADRPAAVQVQLTGRAAAAYTLAEARILAGDSDCLDLHNSFAEPQTVRPADFAAQVSSARPGQFRLQLPAASVLLLRFSQARES
ncbi:MAG: alpha-L-arabinofuranosidase C-terminal domain-containing protein [Oscillospiraceae bacterium]|nr:alpha-L-arabinofuranosidase C-terminal domain-containing protein [Oscillospiraceae bacterium]MDD4367426.1 alpha-L-arabinofuranosidase C-terminal domain-containing protein [Oscillospiraceae bacterium]